MKNNAATDKEEEKKLAGPLAKRNSLLKDALEQESSTRGSRASCGPRASFVRLGKGISQNTIRYEY